MQKKDKSHNAFVIYRRSVNNVEKLGHLLQSRRRDRDEVSLQSMSSYHESTIKSIPTISEFDKSFNFLNEEFKNATREVFK